MPAQGLPALGKDASITTGKLQNGISYYLVTNPSMKGAADFALVRKDFSDTLVARKELTSLPHFNKTIPYKFLSRKGIGCGKEGFITYRDASTVFRFNSVPMFDQAASDTTLLMLFDLIAAQPRQHAIVVAGDINPAAILEKMRVFVMMVPFRNPGYKKPGYAWKPAGATEYSYNPGGASSVTVDFRSARTPDEQLNTIQPFLSQLFALELKEVVSERIQDLLRTRGIPATGIEVDYQGSDASLGDERFLVRVSAPEAQLLPASMALASVLSGTASKPVGTEEFKAARETVLSGLREPVTNAEYVNQCISAYMAGSDLASRDSKLQYFTSRNMPVETELKLFNSYASALLKTPDSVTWSGKIGDYDEWTYPMMFKSTWNGISMVEKPVYAWRVSSSDTLGFASGKGKLKIKSTSLEPVSRGEMWSFSNGMTVIYKRRDTKGMFSYALMVKGGYSTIRELQRGEGAFFSEMMFLDRIAGMRGSDFSKVLKTNGVEMKVEVSPADMRISGSAPCGKLKLVLKAMLSIANDRNTDPEAFDAYRRQELARLKPAVLDSLMYPDYSYSEVKTPSGLVEQTQSDAAEYFSRQFVKVNDGVLVLVGSFPSDVVQKILVKHLGGFRVSRSYTNRPNVSYKLRTGTLSFSKEGPVPQISIALACSRPFTTEHFMAFKIAGLALKRRLTGAMAEHGFAAEMNDRFSIYPLETGEIIFHCSPVLDAGLPDGVRSDELEALAVARRVVEDVLSKPVSEAELNACKALLKNVYEADLSDPDKYVEAILMRYSYGKDVITNYADRIGSVTAGHVAGTFKALSEGMRIEYVVKKK